MWLLFHLGVEAGDGHHLGGTGGGKGAAAQSGSRDAALSVKSVHRVRDQG